MLHLDNFIFEKICYFSLHALIKLIGEDEVNFWISKVPKMALEGNQNSDSMEMEEIEKEDSEQSITFLSAMKTYDDGVSYEGIFPGKIGSVSDTPSDEDVADENYTKQMFHLFSQVCFIDSAILGVYMNIYSLSVEKVSGNQLIYQFSLLS